MRGEGNSTPLAPAYLAAIVGVIGIVILSFMSQSIPKPTKNGEYVWIAIHVTDANGGKGVPDARVQIREVGSPDILRETVTDKAGKCELQFMFPATETNGLGTAVVHGALRIQAQGFRDYEQPFTEFFGNTVQFKRRLSGLKCEAPILPLN